MPVRMIPVHVERTPPPAPACDETAEVLALLAEIESGVERLHANGERSAIDTLRLPLSARARELLSIVLGEGEVNATVEVGGRTRIAETAVPCVWWISHWDARHKLQSESIEITPIPALLRSDIDAIPAGLAELRSRIARLESTYLRPTSEPASRP